MWVSFLISTRMIQYQQVEVVAEFTRNVLEKTGYRMSMDAAVVFLVGSRAGQMVSSGQSLAQIDLALTDLFVRPNGYQPLKSFWFPFHPGKISQIRSIKAILNEMSELQVGSRLVLTMLHELQMVVADIESAQPQV